MGDKISIGGELYILARTRDKDGSMLRFQFVSMNSGNRLSNCMVEHAWPEPPNIKLKWDSVTLTKEEALYLLDGEIEEDTDEQAFDVLYSKQIAGPSWVRKVE